MCKYVYAQNPVVPKEKRIPYEQVLGGNINISYIVRYAKNEIIKPSADKPTPNLRLICHENVFNMLFFFFPYLFHQFHSDATSR